MDKIRIKKTTLILLVIGIITIIYTVFLCCTKGIVPVNVTVLLSYSCINFLMFYAINKKYNDEINGVIYGEKDPNFLVIFSILTYIAAHLIIIFMVLPIIGFGLSHKKIPKLNKLDYIVVHGSIINEDAKKNSVVVERLNKAIELANIYPKSRIVLSGGKMRYSQDSEARYMALYLIEHGIKMNRILLEEKSYNTYTNIDYSLSIIENDILRRNMYNPIIQFPFKIDSNTTTDYGESDIVFLSSDFHLYRISLMVTKRGYGESFYVGADSELLYKPIYYIRECLSLIKAYLVGQI